MKTPIVTAEWLNNNINHKDIIILDASLKTNISGDVSELKNIQIKAARYFDIDNVFSDLSIDLPHMLAKPQQFEDEARKLGINKDSKIVVYDNIGVYSSPRVYWMFKVMGHKNISILDGGLPEWVKNNFSTEEKKSSQVKPGNFSATYDSSLVRNIEDINLNIKSQKELVIDARSEGRFDGTAPEPREWLQSGHIKGSKNLPFDNVIRNGKFKSKEEITKLFDNFDIKKKPVIFSCGSGLTACILFAAFEVCEFNNKTSVYDGSWTEWAQSKYFNE